MAASGHHGPTEFSRDQVDQQLDTLRTICSECQYHWAGNPYSLCPQGQAFENVVTVFRASIAMSLMDIIKDEGGHPACFLDTGGGLSKERMKNGVGLLLRKAKSDPRIKAILVNAIMVLSPADAVAEGIIEAINEVKVEIPIIVILAGKEEQRKRR